MSTTSQPEVVVITGATAGVGRATTRRFAREGARIGLLARGREGLEATRREVEELGGQALAIPTDVADFDQVEAAARRVEEEFGPIDVWINNAMVTVMARFKDMTMQDFERVTKVTYLGVVHGTYAALERMIPRGRGKIVQVGSALAYRGIPLQSAYCGAKHAIQGFTESVRTELMHDGIDIGLSMVQLPALNTPQFEWSKVAFDRQPQPVPPIYEPEVAADAIHYCAHHDRREMYVGQAAVRTIIGNKIAPALGDWYLARKGFEGQLTDRPIDADRKDNLWQPVEGDFGAHGAFDQRASEFSPQVWASKNRGWIAAAAGVAAAAAGVYALTRPD